MTKVVKGINMLFNKKELKGIREYYYSFYL